ncbi:group II truncated hemoglobin [Amycolatopsis rhabdoformis]|uniref:Group II truncated hemoglobin n=1 Tax=Amycolatopsis rhabdoformis TaxID=1448059 RepID=A0ABZ1I9Y2_9PSEU|nr:group II truncated hemoglobin [Amycolatopsis rhabdoformis]WSE30804.1 group II truncated hemoglobin [Amycolatopsis rhabdoformis]
MTVHHLRYTIPAERAAAFEAACAEAASALEKTPQFLGHDLSRRVDDPTRYLLTIRWTSVEHPPFTALADFAGDLDESHHWTPVGGEPPTLYDWAGGAPALVRLLRVFYDHVLQDPLLEPVFRGMDAHHPDHVAVWLGEVLGGPADYSAHHGGHPHMIGRHLGRAITEEQRRRWVSLLLDAADETGLPADPEFRASFAGYVEWGSRLAVVFSAPGAEASDEPVPHWDWVKPPWQAS